MRTCCAWLLACALAGCASGGSEAAEYQADTAGRRDSIAAVAAATMDEPQVIGLLVHVNSVDSAIGAVGGARGSTREIKDFGLMIAREHLALNRDARTLADGLRIAPARPAAAPDAPPPSFAAALEAAAGGSAWDRAYVEYVIAAHDAALENVARALAATRSPATRDYIRRSVPILQKHLDKARSLQKTLARAEPASPATPVR